MRRRDHVRYAASGLALAVCVVIAIVSRDLHAVLGWSVALLLLGIAFLTERDTRRALDLADKALNQRDAAWAYLPTAVLRPLKKETADA